MFKLKRLNAGGFSHHMLIAFIILVVGVGGTYWLVKDHADQSLTGVLYTVQNNQVYSMNTDGSNVQALNINTGSPDPITQVAVNSSGNELAISTGYNIYTANPFGKDVQNITNYNGEQYEISNIAWTADNTIVFGRAVGGGSDFLQIYSINADGSNLTDLTPGDTYDINMTVSSDGSDILYQYEGNDDGTPGPWFEMGVDGSNQTEVTGLENIKDSSGNQLSVVDSPILINAKTGSQIIAAVVPFNLAKGDQAQCTIDSINTSTGAAQQLFTYSNFICQSLALSPDGASVAFSLIPVNPDDTPGVGNVYILPDAIVGSDSSGTVSGATVSNTSGDTSVSWGPVIPPVYSASCSVNPLPANIAVNGSVTPTITVTNTGNQPISPEISYNFGKGSTTQSLTLSSVAPGAWVTQTLASYKLFYSGNYSLYITGSANGTPFNCQSNSVTVPASYAADCNITNVPSDVNKGSNIQPTVNFKNIGNMSLVNIYETSFTLKFNTGNGHSFNLSELTNVNLPSGQSWAISPIQYTLPTSTKAVSGVITVGAKATNVSAFSCSKAFKIKS